MSGLLDTRHVRPWGPGLLQGLALAPGSVERRVLAQLLIAGETLPLDLQALARRLSLRAGEVGKALFALNRMGCIAVLDSRGDEASWQPAGLGELTQAMAQLAQPQQGLLLASADGLVIAATGVGAEAAKALAAQLCLGGLASTTPAAPWGHEEGWGDWQTAPLWAGAQRLVLLWSHTLDVQQPAWLRVAAGLLQAHGEWEK